jgi:hypothetical protein
MSDSKGKNAADQLAQKLDDTTIIAAHKRKWLQAMEQGTAINVRKMVADSEGKLVNCKSGGYYSDLWFNKQADFIDWFWSWEPPMGGRAVGGGEMALILSEVSGGKGGDGGGGDVSWSDLAIEVKKAETKGAGGGAGFGKNTGFQNARSIYLKFVKDTKGLPKAVKDDALGLGFGGMGKGGFAKTIVNETTAAQRFSTSMNGITIPLVTAGRTPREIDSMWSDVCTACMGSAGIPFSATSTDGTTDINEWMHTWCANGLDAYAEKEGHQLLFAFDPESLNAISFKSGRQFLEHQLSGGEISYDWAVDWKEMGYGNFVPRFKVKKYKKEGAVKGMKGLEELISKMQQMTTIANFLKDPVLPKTGKLRNNANKKAIMTMIGAKDDSQFIKKLRPWLKKNFKGDVTKVLDKSKRQDIVRGLKKLK